MTKPAPTDHSTSFMWLTWSWFDNNLTTSDSLNLNQDWFKPHEESETLRSFSGIMTFKGVSWKISLHMPQTKQQNRKGGKILFNTEQAVLMKIPLKSKGIFCCEKFINKKKRVMWRELPNMKRVENVSRLFQLFLYFPRHSNSHETWAESKS